jgi:hypothetical protein
MHTIRNKYISCTAAIFWLVDLSFFGLAIIAQLVYPQEKPDKLKLLPITKTGKNVFFQLFLADIQLILKINVPCYLKQ